MISKKNLKIVIEAQRKWITEVDKGVTREKLDEVKPIRSFALNISGIRRCGKSTLMGQILKSRKIFYYLNLDDPRLEGFELKDFSNADDIFKELYGSGGVYCIDEIQNVDKWEMFIRFLTDHRSKVVITGSNASLLSRELGTRLTGRHLSYELFPFSYSEFLRFYRSDANEKTFSDYLYKGGFPEFLREKNVTILHDLLNDVLMRDIVNRFGIKNTSILRKLALYLLSNVGKEYSSNSLKKMFEVKTVRTVIDYISYMEDSYLVFTIPRFSYSFNKQQVNPKKAYSIDNGLSNANSVSFSNDRGRMLENSVFLHLRRKHKDLYYFREERECDFLVRDRGKIVQAIQVCYDFNDENEGREVNGLLEAMKKFGLKKGLIITYDQEDELTIDGKRIILKPAWKWMSGK